ncbi:hypothetical protein [Mongoliitalea daihaiensis]|uniref:hypothetical protein n=1 Tax=Mongoliitalea daihaiensis TaxID=2782006 RepID=UPI001F237C9E|nr:hypothetical protein [Mongoliitalea daihaiensis]UJP64658.1 hypothetical protein IPZ59_17935 [Mongoliitalea daihaiensis]
MMRHRLIVYSVIVVLLGIVITACKEFENNNFTTFLGAIVDADGRPIAGVELFFVENPDWWNREGEMTFDRIIYEQRTNALGEFRFIVPRRNFDAFYGIKASEPELLLFEQFDQEFTQSIYPVSDGQRGADGVVNVGLIQLLRP